MSWVYFSRKGCSYLPMEAVSEIFWEGICIEKYRKEFIRSIFVRFPSGWKEKFLIFWSRNNYAKSVFTFFYISITFEESERNSFKPTALSRVVWVCNKANFCRSVFTLFTCICKHVLPWCDIASRWNPIGLGLFDDIWAKYWVCEYIENDWVFCFSRKDNTFSLCSDGCLLQKCFYLRVRCIFLKSLECRNYITIFYRSSVWPFLIFQESTCNFLKSAEITSSKIRACYLCFWIVPNQSSENKTKQSFIIGVWAIRKGTEYIRSFPNHTDTHTPSRDAYIAPSRIDIYAYQMQKHYPKNNRRYTDAIFAKMLGDGGDFHRKWTKNNRSRPSLCNKVWNHRKENKKNNTYNSDIVKDFFSTSAFKFSKITWTRDDRKSTSFWLECYHDDEKYSDNDKKSLHKNGREI